MSGRLGQLKGRKEQVILTNELEDLDSETKRVVEGPICATWTSGDVADLVIRA